MPDRFVFFSVDSVRRIPTNCINVWSSRLVSMSWKWRCGYWSTSLQAPRLQDQQGPWLLPTVLLRPTNLSLCCWRSTMPCVKLHAPSAVSYSPWSVCVARDTDLFASQVAKCLNRTHLSVKTLFLTYPNLIFLRRMSTSRNSRWHGSCTTSTFLRIWCTLNQSYTAVYLHWLHSWSKTFFWLNKDIFSLV